MQPAAALPADFRYTFPTMGALPATTLAAASSTPATSAPTEESKVVQQVKEWLDTPKGKLTTTEMWKVIEKLTPVENFQMLLYAVELLKGRLGKLSSNVRLLWVLQLSLRTFSTTEISLDAKPVLKSRALCLEMSVQFWKYPPIAFFRDLHCILHALQETSLEGATESFKNLVKDKDNWKNQAAFLRDYFYNCVTVDCKDNAGIPFLDLRDVHDYLRGRGTVLFVKPLVYEAISPTDLRILSTKGDVQVPMIGLEELPTAQRTQLKSTEATMEPVLMAIQERENSNQKQIQNSLMMRVMSLLPTFMAAVQNEPNMTDSEAKNLALTLSTMDCIGFFEQFRRIKLDPHTNLWEDFFKEYGKALVAHYDGIALSMNLTCNTVLGLLGRLSRLQRKEVLERLILAFKEEKTFASVLNDYFTPQQVDAFLKPILPN